MDDNDLVIVLGAFAIGAAATYFVCRYLLGA